MDWIVDIGDPFYFMKSTPTNNHKIYSKLNLKFEKYILARATQVSVTNSTVLQKYTEIFPECRNKICVIPPVLSAVNSEHKKFFPDNGKIRLVYIGTLYKKIRSPETMLKIFNKEL